MYDMANTQSHTAVLPLSTYQISQRLVPYLTWQYEKMEPCLKLRGLEHLQYYVPRVEAQSSVIKKDLLISVN